MSFFNLTMLGYQSPIKQCQVDNLNDHLPSIKGNKKYFSNQMDSNLKYHEIRTKHIREPRSNINLLLRLFNIALTDFDIQIRLIYTNAL